MALPHLKNSQSGLNKFDPVHNSIFEINFTIPEALRTTFGADEAILTEQVNKISGLEGLNKGPELVKQQFMGTTRSYLAPKLGETNVEFEIEFALNLRGDNRTDNFIYKLLRAWNKLGYNMETGETTLKKEYCAEWFQINIANREGDIIRQILMKDVIMHGGLGGWGDLDYTANEPVTITAKFNTDWWDDTDAE